MADLPAKRRAALDQLVYAPMLMVNVALRNWRFFDRLGFSCARWFDRFGLFSATRRPMAMRTTHPMPAVRVAGIAAMKVVIRFSGSGGGVHSHLLARVGIAAGGKE